MEPRSGLPRGTRVVLKVDCAGDDGSRHRAGTLATVRDLTRQTFTETPGGRSLHVQRDQTVLQRRELLAQLGQRAWLLRQLRDEVIYAGGGRQWAWDRPGRPRIRISGAVSVAPFDAAAGLWDRPDEIQNPAGEEAYWEIEKFFTRGCAAMPTRSRRSLAPLHKVVTPLGQGCSSAGGCSSRCIS